MQITTKKVKGFSEAVKFLTDKTEIENWLKKMNIKNYKVNADGTVDVNGNVDISNKGLVEIPVRFNIVKGNFDCRNNKLTTLEGSPKKVYGYFDCSKNKLKNLKGAPQKVEKDFDCRYNDIKRSEDISKNVGGKFISDYSDEDLYDDINNYISGWVYNVLGHDEDDLRNAYDNPEDYVDEVVKDIMYNFDLTKNELIDIMDKREIEQNIESEAQGQLDNNF